MLLSNIKQLKLFITLHKITLVLFVILALLIFGGTGAYLKFISGKEEVLQEQTLGFDPEGPYALVYPRRDGNAIILNLTRTASYDEISYEISYVSRLEEIRVEGRKIEQMSLDGELGSQTIDRGVVGTIDTKMRKGEYEQEILFGTCSKNVCKYDKGVENGTLTLRIKKGKQVFKMVTGWRLQKVDVALGVLTSLDGHFVYKLGEDRKSLARVGLSIINDLTGVPKLPRDREVLGKVYAINVPIGKDLMSGQVSIELVQTPPPSAKIARYAESQNRWVEYETKIEGSKLTAQADGAGIFAVLIPGK